MSVLIEISSTFGAALLGALVYLLEDQRPHHRPFSRAGYRFTLLAGLWIAVITTAVVMAATLFLSSVWPQALAVVAPVGTKVAAQGAHRKQQLDQPTLLQKISTLGVALALEYLNGKLSEQKHDHVDRWMERPISHVDVIGIGMRAQGRLADRRLPGVRALSKRVAEGLEAYKQAHTAFVRTQDPKDIPLARQRLSVAQEDFLKTIYEARLDQLVRATPRRAMVRLPSRASRTGTPPAQR